MFCTFDLTLLFLSLEYFTFRTKLNFHFVEDWVIIRLLKQYPCQSSGTQKEDNHFVRNGSLHFYSETNLFTSVKERMFFFFQKSFIDVPTFVFVSLSWDFFDCCSRLLGPLLFILFVDVPTEFMKYKLIKFVDDVEISVQV